MGNLKLRNGVCIIQTYFFAFSKEMSNAIIGIVFHLVCSSEHCYVICINSFKARDNFHGDKNKIFDLKKFRHCSIKKVYDSLHGIPRDYVELSEIVEIMAYCLMDGKIEQKSVFETRLYEDSLEQLKNDKE